jgi:copper transport protein
MAAAPAPDEPAAGTPRLRSGVQGVQYAALLLAAGLVAFSVLLPGTVPRTTTRRLRRVTLAAGLVAALADLALVPLSGAVKLDRGLDALTATAAWDVGLVGHEWVAASLLAIGLAVATVASRRTARRGRVIALAGAALALTSPSLVGHTRSVDPEPLLVLTDIAHLVAGAIWFGGLVGLVLTLRALSREDAAGVLSRFSTAAASSLAVLVAMGSVLSWRILGSWDNLLHTTYGALLLVKIAVVALAVAVAMVNRFILLPRVYAAARREAPGRSAGLIRRAVAVEGALLTVALLVTGFLVDQAPHPQETFVAVARPGPQTGIAGDLRVVASLSSGTIGPNTLRIETQTLAGDPRATRQLPVVSVRSGSLDLGRVTVTRTGPGAYRVPVILPEGGIWQVQVSVRLGEFDNPVLTLPFPVA